MIQPQVTVLTTTYNRANLLQKCYQSLRKQSSKNFEWLIIDDGSTDHTTETVGEFQSHEREFEIHYYKKQNGGKHTAWNFSHPYIQGEVVCFLDDDDELTEDAVETILTYWDKYSENERIWCMSFQKKCEGMKGRLLCDWPGDRETVSNHILFRVNRGLGGDCAEVVRSNVFKKFTFPTFENERFLGEGFLWVNAARQYDTVYIKRVIYLCEYLPGGLTKSGRAMRMKNPYGGMCSSNMYLEHGIALHVQVKHAILYDCYAIASGKPVRALQKSNRKWLCLLMTPFGAFFYMKWSRNRKEKG